jgi:hypothetical protein
VGAAHQRLRWRNDVKGWLRWSGGDVAATVSCASLRSSSEMAYNAFLGRPALSKTMVIPHYAYLVLKMPGPHGVISIRRDIKCVNDCDRESCEMTDRYMAPTVLQDMK